MADAASLAALSIEVWVGTYLRQGASSFFAELVLSEFTAAWIEAIVDGGIDFLIFSENLDGIDGNIRVKEVACSTR